MMKVLRDTSGREWVRLSDVPASQREAARAATHAAISPVIEATITAQRTRAMQDELDRLTGVVLRLQGDRRTASAPQQREHPLDVAAAAVRAENPTLTMEKATAIALERNPSLYDVQYEDAPVVGGSNRAVLDVDPCDLALTSAALVMSGLEPTLSQEQAIARALDIAPSLYCEGGQIVKVCDASARRFAAALSEMAPVDLPDGSVDFVPLMPRQLVEHIESKAQATYPDLELEQAVAALFGDDGDSSWPYYLYKASAEFHRSSSES